MKPLREILTPREFEAAQLVHECLINKEIAALQNVSEDTIKHRLYAIYNKVGCDTRSALAIIFERELVREQQYQ